MKKKTKNNNSLANLQSLIPQNIGQYLYKNKKGYLEKLFPNKSIRDIRKIIRWL